MTELAPQEDQGVILSQSIAAPNATLKQRQLYSHEVYEDLLSTTRRPSMSFKSILPGQSISGMALKPWDARSKSTNALQPVVQQEKTARSPASEWLLFSRHLCPEASVCRFSS